MKPILTAALIVAAAIVPAIVPAQAQSVISPEVHPDGSITFRFLAPKAGDVQLHCEGVPDTDMTQNAHGLWTYTTKPLDPDIYTYTFDVDGVRVIDPLNSFMKYNLLSSASQVEVPGPPSSSLPWQIVDVSRGELHRHFFRSAVCNDNRDFIVYTPPGYNPRAFKRYPVLYLLHGFSDDTTAWTEAGRANVILDNLITRGKARPMIVVMPLGYGDMAVLQAGHDPAGQALRQRSQDKFVESLLTEVIPRVEKEYHVSTNRRDRAIAGLSMGGKEALVTGLNHLDKFTWVGAFSSGGMTNFDANFPALDAGANKQLRLLWIGCGNDDGLLKPNQELCHWLLLKGIQFTWTELPGQHSYRVWRRDLAQFAPLLFQPENHSKFE
ncbi:MAG TPA: alpha/beta hydrolase-fold protein [Candidatus Acidoferrales bacterium]|jgi:enterochelin esterase-like enzyme|nr:alpha/beta hydrolase-fold protein [Candidatus Acidoferrales bacterium]